MGADWEKRRTTLGNAHQTPSSILQRTFSTYIYDIPVEFHEALDGCIFVPSQTESKS